MAIQRTNAGFRYPDQFERVKRGPLDIRDLALDLTSHLATLQGSADVGAGTWPLPWAVLTLGPFVQPANTRLQVSMHARVMSTSATANLQTLVQQSTDSVNWFQVGSLPIAPSSSHAAANHEESHHCEVEIAAQPAARNLHLRVQGLVKAGTGRLLFAHTTVRPIYRAAAL